MGIGKRSPAASLRALMTFLLLAPGLALAAVWAPAAPADAANGSVSLSISSGPPGTLLTVTGSNYTANSTFTVIFANGSVATGFVSASGTINTSFFVPVLPRGAYAVGISTNASDTNQSVPNFTVSPLLSLVTPIGGGGDLLGVSGKGMAASTTVTVYFDGVAMATVTSDTLGSFSTSFTVPTTVAGLHSVTAGDYTGVGSGVNFTVLPKLTISEASLTVNSTFTVTGTGFAASSPVTFLLDDVDLTRTVNTNTVGGFTMGNLSLPETTAGTHTLRVHDASSNSATVTITVNPAVTVSPENGTAGTAITLNGKGFSANTPLRITWSGQTISTSPVTVTTDFKGSFTANLNALPGASTAYAVAASDGTNLASASFVIKPTGSINPASGPVGAPVTIKGQGFKASGGVTISYDNFLAASVSADATGNLSATIQVLPSGAGEHKITVTDQTNTLTFQFRVVSTATLNPANGVIGTDVTVSGAGFAPSRPITIKYDDTQVVQGTADTSGAFTIVFKAPVSRGGSHLITVTDAVNTQTLTFSMDAAAPTVPVIFQPASLAKVEPLPTLDWSDVTDPSGVTYSMELATDAAFANIVLRKTGLTTSAYTVGETEKLRTAGRSKPYHWRVKAADGALNESAWSEPATFVVGVVLESWAWIIIIGGSVVILGVGGYLVGTMIRRRILH